MSAYRCSSGRPARASSAPPADRRALSALILALALLTSCARTTAGGPTSTPGSPTPAHSGPATIRFALVGSVTDANVWALFDKPGYSYNNYAVRSSYWPRLYSLSIPDNQLEAVAAAGLPSSVRQEGTFYTATVPLRADLTWSDGSPFTAEDVAFIINAALEFHLGYDWQAYYDPSWLDHVEATEPHTAKFFFKQMPNVGVWQLGALQGPVVQRAYWAPKIAGPAGLLPGAELAQQIQALQEKIATLQAQLNLLNLSTYTTLGEEARQTQAGLKRQQGDLDQALNTLTKTQGEYDQALNAARTGLYALDDKAEPLLGTWQPAKVQRSAGAAPAFANDFNPALPGSPPRFAHADYYTYATAEAAQAALQAGTMDVLLKPGAQAAAGDGLQAMTSPSRSLRFLALNLASDTLKDAPLRRALACLIDQGALVSGLGGKAVPLESFVSPEESLWYNASAVPACNGLDATARLSQAISTLKAAGYTWVQEPSAGIAGRGLASPAGKPLADMQLLAPSSDDLRGAAAGYIQQQALLLGIPLRTRTVSADTIDYAVFSSQHYDMAILGWSVSPYPGYLCDWFAVGKPFHYDPSQLTSSCGTLNATSDLEAAKKVIFDIQTSLATETPMIPLFSETTVDVYRNIAYPFTHVLDGLYGVYGAPAMASPASH